VVKRSTVDMANLIAQNFYDFREYYVNIPGAKIDRSDQMTLIETGIPSSSWNAILSKNSQTNQELQDRFPEIESFYRFSCTCWIGPEQNRKTLEDVLQSQGFRAMGTTAAMALQISKVKELSYPNPEIKIVSVRSIRELEFYLSVLKKSFSMPQYAIDKLYGMFSRFHIEDSPVFYHYLGFLGSKAVGCASLFVTGESIGIYYVGTLPEYRGRGVGKMMTQYCLKKAREMDFSYAVLRASAFGEPIYRQLGFREYGQFCQYNRIIHPVYQLRWKAGYYFKLVLDKFTGDAIWFS